ncbi:hypothetical protein J6590_079215 [Homalodisca vitripennis]|nr:hypothetical protein J6590_079215 [Homalodisca vitripennis]
MCVGKFVSIVGANNSVVGELRKLPLSSSSVCVTNPHTSGSFVPVNEAFSMVVTELGYSAILHLD